MQKIDFIQELIIQEYQNVFREEFVKKVQENYKKKIQADKKQITYGYQKIISLIQRGRYCQTTYISNLTSKRIF
ncbi:unnamed protein product [Paramecium sonneborni]|uniref:Uncharacterized protein n=1 Tax=Paramecium sonneborni TaxID=65129 RepID=A0A8S1QEM0_9CILI|nr:unnamed protein product [Paramecium sonneborni]